MAINRALLMAVAGWLLVPDAVALAAKASCLHCHRPHYQASGTCVSCHRGDDRSDRLGIAHHDLIPARFAWCAIEGAAPVHRGRELLDRFACRRCHTTAGKGNRLASDLDRLPDGTTPHDIYDAMKAPALFMPDFRFDDRQLVDLVNAVAAGAKKAGRQGKRSPKTVHFVDEKRGEGNVFEKRCGSCHKVLTGSLGGLGKGEIGPNLSGLFSGRYPVTLSGDRSWTAELLKKWLENPRKMREHTQMRPVPLEKDESERLLAVFTP